MPFASNQSPEKASEQKATIRAIIGRQLEVIFKAPPGTKRSIASDGGRIDPCHDQQQRIRFAPGKASSVPGRVDSRRTFDYIVANLHGNVGFPTNEPERRRPTPDRSSFFAEETPRTWAH
jgi:hypothetical protein